MNEKIKKLLGANMDIDFSNKDWGNSVCPWNEADGTDDHKCTVKNTSICKFFVEYNIWTAFCAVIHMKIYLF